MRCVIPRRMPETSARHSFLSSASSDDLDRLLSDEQTNRRLRSRGHYDMPALYPEFFLACVHVGSPCSELHRTPPNATSPTGSVMSRIAHATSPPRTRQLPRLATGPEATGRPATRNLLPYSTVPRGSRRKDGAIAGVRLCEAWQSTSCPYRGRKGGEYKRDSECGRGFCAGGRSVPSSCSDLLRYTASAQGCFPHTSALRCGSCLGLRSSP